MLQLEEFGTRNDNFAENKVSKVTETDPHLLYQPGKAG